MINEITIEMLEAQAVAEAEAMDRGRRGRTVARAGLEAVAPLILAAYQRESADLLGRHGWCPDPSRHEPSEGQNPPVPQADFDDVTRHKPLLDAWAAADRQAAAAGLAVHRADALQAICTLLGPQTGRPGTVISDATYESLLKRAEQFAYWIATGERPC